MSFQDLNQSALECLSKGNFKGAQDLFYKCSKEYPCHEAYNNLGLFLCTEGLESEKGKVRNADKLGLHYLKKAQALKKTEVNSNNLASIIDRECTQLYYRKGTFDVSLLQSALEYENDALKIKYTYRNDFNRLRFLFLIDSNDRTIIPELFGILPYYHGIDCIQLLLNALIKQERFIECEEIARKYEKELDEIALLYVCTNCGLYGRGAQLCQDICEKYTIDSGILAMLYECLLRSDNQYEATELMASLFEDVDYRHITKTEAKKLLCDEEYRKVVIKKYCLATSFDDSCGYFGCKKHGTI